MIHNFTIKVDLLNFKSKDSYISCPRTQSYFFYFYLFFSADFRLELRVLVPCTMAASVKQ